MQDQSSEFIVRTCERCGIAFSARARFVRAGNARFCSRACRYGTPLERLWSKVQVSDDPDACWPHGGALNAQGQTKLTVNGRDISASRLTWLLTVGPIPEGFDVCHTCDNPPCCRNDEEGFYEIGGILRPRRGHLWLGTPAENSRDMALKGRSTLGYEKPTTRGDRNPSRLYPERLKRGDDHPSRIHPERVARGERHGSARLTAEQVREIRQLGPTLTRSELGRRFGVNASNISHILTGKTWRDPTAGWTP